MTYVEYKTRRDRIAVSEATTSAKYEAIEVLDEAYFGSSSIEVAKQQLEESQADTSDITGDE